MNNELKDTRMGLDTLNEFLKQKKQLENRLSTETKYVAEEMCKLDTGLKQIKPQEPKKYDNLKAPRKPKRELRIALIMISVNAVIFFLLHNMGIMEWLDVVFEGKNIVGLYFALRILSTIAIPFTLFCSFGLIKDYIGDYKEYKEELVDYEKKKNYMEVEYPSLAKEYKSKKEIYDQKYREVYDFYYSEGEKKKVIWRQQLEELANKMKPVQNIISSKYYNNLDSIIEIIDSGRASSLKEAINVFHSDEFQKERISEARQLREAQEERNRIAQWEAEERINNERRHQEKMERYQQELQDSMERGQREQEQRERDAGRAQCHHCKRASHCSYATMSANTGHCAAFIPSTLL